MAKPDPNTGFLQRHGFAPQSHAMALEPRILFDGAAASAVDQQHADPAHAADAASHPAIPAAAVADATPPAAPPPPAAHALVVIDSRVDNRAQLAAQLPADTRLLVVDAGTDGLAAISAALAEMGKVDSIQIFSHGASGQFTLGSRTLSSDNLGQAGDLLGSWRSELNPGADIQLYGCRVGAGSAGQALVSELAHWTGADVGASADDTGNAAAGGNWTLEVRSGDVDKAIALSPVALAGFEGLLADAAPTVSVSSGGSDVLLGGQYGFTLNFSNASVQQGFAPYIDLFLPATGKDGNDGTAFISATYLGQAVQSFTLTFDAAGNAIHPLARDAAGNPVVITAASVGMRPGDQFVVLELPFGSVSQDQPVISVQVTAGLSPLADTDLSNGAPDLTVRARGGFQFGNDALDNPTQDPSRVEGALHDFVVHPTLLTINQSLDMPEGETATGPNFSHVETVTVTPAPGQTLHDVSVTQAVPPNVQVTNIAPGGGGVLSSVTLGDGSVVTNATLIAAVLANDAQFITSYTVTYATLSGPVQTLVTFFVPGAEESGTVVLDPITGDAVTIAFAAPTATGQWTPVDPRDEATPGTDIGFTSTGDGTGGTFVARSISIVKEASVDTDIGSPGLSPGDTLRYTLNLAVSDFFAFGQNLFGQGSFTITDQLGDGQVYNGPATLSVTRGGITQTIALDVTSTVNADGTTTLVFDLARSLQTAPGSLLLGALVGDLAFEDVRSGATTAIINYGAVVAQSYATSHPPQSELNEGDAFGNNAIVSGTILEDPINLTGGTETDVSSVTHTIPTHQVDITLASVNGSTPSGSPELRPGDVVTFRMSYDLTTGDYEQFRLTAYLPLPLLSVGSLTWTQGTGVGQWTLGAGNTNPDAIDSVVSGPGNSIIFDFGDYATSSTAGSRIEVEFTLRVGDQPFADQRSLDVLAQSDQLTTIVKNHLSSSDVVAIVSVAEPTLDIRHGVVSSSNGTVTGTTGSWSAPGTSGVPFQGSVTDLSAIDGNVGNIDAGDTLRLATAIENRGGGGAFDVQTSVTLPAGLGFVGGSLANANLRIYRGDGTLLVAGTDYSVSGNQISFLDAGAVASLLPGRAGTAADASGSNLVVITYDVQVDNAIAAAATLQSSAALSNYASVDGGTDFTPTDATDIAGQQIATPEVRKNFAGGTLDDSDSSAPHTTGSNLVVGESMLYDVVVTLPEGGTQALRLDDLVPAGMRLDTSFNGGLGYQLITTVAGSAALGADFNGSVTPGTLTGVGGTLGNDGVDGRLAFTAAGATADNQAGNNSFVIRVRLVVGNFTANQAGRTPQNDARLTFSDPDTDTPNGSTPTDRTVAVTGGRPTVTVREPTLVLTQTTPPVSGFGVDEGDIVEYTITLRNGTATSDYDAFDISFLDNLPSQLSLLGVTSVSYLGGATNNGGADFELVGQQLRSVAGANIDVPRGGSIVLVVRGIANASVASVPGIVNNASAQWTSLDGAVAGERTGTDGTLDSGVLNDYRVDSALTVSVARGTQISHVGGVPDTPTTVPTTAINQVETIGEIVHYRVVAILAEGSAADYNLQITLQNGLQYLDGSLLIGFGSTRGLTTDIPDLIVGGNGPLSTPGNEASPGAQPLSPNLGGDTTAVNVINPAYITTTIDANGNTVLVIRLGTLVNSDFDADLEGFAVEFNARVLNQASNTAGTVLSVRAVDRSGTTELSAGSTVTETLVEPGFAGIDKRVIDFDPNPSGTTGTATVALSFTENGGVAAFDAQLRDAFAGGSGYTLVSLSLNGTVYTAANLPPGIVVGTTGGLAVDFDRLAVGDQVRVVYQVTLPNTATIATSNAVLTWSSLPESFTSWGGSSVGVDGTAQGERTGSGVAPNTYVLAEGAGLGLIQGTLWDDTASATASAVPDGPVLAGQTVSLTWAGLDGDLATTADNRVYSTVTDSAGQYRFGVLPAGVFRIDTPNGTITYPQPLGGLRVRIDTDAASPLGQVVVTLGESASATADAGYVQQNDAPENVVPGTQNGLEDVALPITGLSVGDVDAGGGTLDVTLSVLHGVLSLSSVPAGVTATGGGTAQLRLSGTISALNAALANLGYLGDADYNGSDTLTMLTGDRGNSGDANGDGIPNQNPGDTLTDQDTVAIVLEAVNDPPSAFDDAAEALEAGGTANRLPGTDPTGNVFDNDTDVDIATNGDQLRIISAGLQGGQHVLLPSIGGTLLVGAYGTLTLGVNGSYEYVVDNDNPVVQALRLAGQTLVERFDYTLSDIEGLHSSAVLVVTVHGANDTPGGVNDTGIAVEAGGVANGSGGSAGTGNLLANDTDVDSTANGEALRVTAVRGVGEASPGQALAVLPGTDSSNGTVIVGLYGTMTVGADGSWRFVVDDNNPAVQRLAPGDTLDQFFSYQVTDAAGLNNVAELRITIQGSNDNPVASDDAAAAQAASTDGDAAESNPTGNVILFPSRAGGPNDPGGNGIDLDVDRTDQPSSQLVVTGIRTDIEGSAGALTAVAGSTTSANGTAITASFALQGGAPITGDFGVLTIGADGSFVFDVNSTNAVIENLAPGESIDVIYTYRVTDTGGLSDLAQLVITVRGVNDPPVAQNVVAQAQEAGGISNATPGENPEGDVTAVATDPDGDPLTVTFIRTGAEGVPGTDIPVTASGTAVVGLYGTLNIRADGTTLYVLDNGNPAVEALRTGADLLIERFTYTINDGAGETDQAEIVVVIRGQNDNPVASDDVATAREAGGINNNRTGIDPTGNVLDNDNDVDGGEVPGDPVNYGETRAVSSVRTGSEAATGADGVLGSELRGAYGWLTLNSDGSYSYRVDNDDPTVQALRLITDTLTDSFSYTVIDASGATDRATLTVTIDGDNDTPTGTPISVIAIEAGGVDNGTPGVDPSGNVLTAFNDVDGPGEQLTLDGFNLGGVAGVFDTPLVGAYGRLVVHANGDLTYLVDNDNPIVQALRTPNYTLTEVFTFRVRDRAGDTRAAPITVTIQGRNDNPVAANDGAIAVEAGGTANATPGAAGTGNLLTNDTDVDSGETRTVTGIRAGAVAAGGDFAAVGASQVIAGQYGTLTVQADGSFSYQVDDSLAVVQAMRPGNTLAEAFSYRMRDTAGALDLAQLDITVRGAWDAPVAVNDIRVAVADNGVVRAIDPVGNALDNDSDVDRDDVLRVSGARAGNEGSGGALLGVNTGTDNSNGTVVTGLYGQLLIGSDGSYIYNVDSGNAAVRALGPLQFLQEVFTYEATDLGGLHDLAEIHIIVRGRNDAPVGGDVDATAVEAGGLNNSVAGVDPSGDVLANDVDAEGDVLSVTGVRTGAEAGSGTDGAIGVALRGLYGVLVVQADGSFQYTLDNSLPEVQALRASGQTVQDVFTYTLADALGADDTAELRITIDGRNDTPVAADDAAIAIEAGGIGNGTPGRDPGGNVLANDSDVDSVANGETRQVVGFGNAAGQSTLAGQALAGLYGQLTVQADGSYSYVLDNANPAVQALRTAGETLRESFTYTMRDTAGATSQARLNVLIQGADDAPVALDDHNVVPSETPAPQASGNVLPNDADIDGGDGLRVVAIRTGEEAGSGNAGAVGQALVGRYGTLVINADGSYTYTIDQNNPDVLASAGVGRVLHDTFTYTVADREGATDVAQLVLDLDIPAPYVAPPTYNYFGYLAQDHQPDTPLPEVRPVVYVGPEVRQVEASLRLSTTGADGSELLWQMTPEIQSGSLGAGLGVVPGQYVGLAVAESRHESELDWAWILGREGRIGLSADGLLADPSLFTPDAEDLAVGEAPRDPQTAQGFRAQLQAAAQRLHAIAPAGLATGE